MKIGLPTNSATGAGGRSSTTVRVAERAATLDHLSGGRVELGLTRSTIPERRLFGIDPETVRRQTQQAFEMISKMWTSDRFSYAGPDFEINDVPISPKQCAEPVGSFVNNQVAYFTFVHCAETDEQAMRNGAAAAAAWYTVTALNFFEAAKEFSRGVAEQQRLMARRSGIHALPWPGSPWFGHPRVALEHR